MGIQFYDNLEFKCWCMGIENKVSDDNKYEVLKEIADKITEDLSIEPLERAYGSGDVWEYKWNIDEDENTTKEKALNNDNVKKFTDGLEIVKVIVIPGRIVNIVVK